MSLLPGFGLPPLAQRLAPKLKALASEGIYIGTSSWKYPGWIDSVYTPDLYVTRGKFSQAKFDANCLAEYAKTFNLVGGDFAFYRFQTADFWKELFDSTPDSLMFALKVPEAITAARWSNQARYGKRAGQDNEEFLDASVFRDRFTALLEPHVNRIASLIFEFGTFSKASFPKPSDFIARLDPFLASLPKGFRYSIEIRNPEYLSPEYFDSLHAHNVAYVFNAWTRSPVLEDQVQLEGAFTADFSVVRALLRKGRSYDDAVKTFEPYKEIQEPNEGARDAMTLIAQRARKIKQPAFLLVNNRLEGFAPGTIEAVISNL